MHATPNIRGGETPVFQTHFISQLVTGFGRRLPQPLSDNAQASTLCARFQKQHLEGGRGGELSLNLPFSRHCGAASL